MRTFLILFLKRVSLLLFVVCLLIGILEVIIESTPNEYSYKNKFVQENGSKIETIVLGTSHPCRAVCPHLFESNTFNLANDSQPLEIDYCTLQRYDSDLKNLKTVILGLSYHSLRMLGIGMNNDEYKLINYNAFMDYKGDSFSLKNRFVFMNSVLFRYYIKRALSRADLGCDSLGRGITTAEKEVAALNRHGIDKSKGHSSLPPANNANFGVLDNIAIFCQSRDIRLVLISTPMWHTFYENMNPEQYEELLSTIGDMQERYGVEHYNFIKDARFGLGDFQDGDHLSAAGAEKFTRILVDTLSL